MRKVRYAKAVLSFIDLLGFRDMVGTRSAHDVSTVLDNFHRFSGGKVTRKDRNEHDPKVIMFSDSIVRIRPVESRSNKRFPIGLLFHEVLDLLHAQGELIHKRVLMRGGVVVGNIHVSKNKVFGPALIEAYDLESKFAQYPRIVISPDVFKALDADNLLRARHHSIGDEKEEIRGMVERAEDGVWFIDYLRAIRSEVDEPSLYLEVLDNHRQLIVEGAKDRLGVSATRLDAKALKFNWLATYHNAVVQEIEESLFTRYGRKTEDFMIGASDVKTLYDL